MTDEEKKVYEEKAEADKRRKESEMQEYVAMQGPKRPLSAFILFSNEIRPSVREENPSSSVVEVAKIIGEKWKSLPESDKRKFQNKAWEEKSKYEQLKEKFESSKV